MINVDKLLVSSWRMSDWWPGCEDGRCWCLNDDGSLHKGGGRTIYKRHIYCAWRHLSNEKDKINAVTALSGKHPQQTAGSFLRSILSHTLQRKKNSLPQGAVEPSIKNKTNRISLAVFLGWLGKRQCIFFPPHDCQLHSILCGDGVTTFSPQWAAELQTISNLPAKWRLLMSAADYLCLPMPTACSLGVPAGSPSRGGDVTVYVADVNQPSLPTPFCSVLVSVSVFMALYFIP